MFVLVVQTGKYGGKRIKVPEDEAGVIIGRDEDAAIRIGSSDVSRKHCLLIATSEGLLVRDLGSRNGTFVDGVPIGDTEPLLLKPGGSLSVGPMTFCLAVAGVKPQRRSPGVPDDALSDDDIAGWLKEGDTSEQMAAADTTIITGRDDAPAPKNAPIRPPKKREFKSVADEAADIIRRYKESRGEAAPDGDTDEN